MSKLLTVFLCLGTLAAVAEGSLCTYYTYTPSRTLHYSYCVWGCCSYNSIGCCDAPFYVTAGFIAPMVIGSLTIFFIIIVVLVIRARRRRLTTIRYGAPLIQPQVVTASSGPVYGGYGSQAYTAPPAYTAQPAR